MAAIAVVTDSSADIPEALVERHGIYVVPQILVVEGERLVEGKDISSREVYEAVRAGKQVSIGHPPPDDFRVVYKKMRKETEGIVTVTLSTIFNPTLISAQVAGITYPKLPTEVINSQHVSMGLGFVTLTAAKAAAQGRSLEEAAQEARDAIPQVRTIFIPERIEYAYKAKYVPKVAYVFHSPLHQVPILEVKKTHIEALDYVRQGPKAWARLVDILQQDIQDRPVQVAIMHADAPDRAQELATTVQSALQVTELHVTTLTPIVGLRTGPGTVGLALYLQDRVE